MWFAFCPDQDQRRGCVHCFCIRCGVLWVPHQQLDCATCSLEFQRNALHTTHKLLIIRSPLDSNGDLISRSSCTHRTKNFVRRRLARTGQWTRHNFLSLWQRRKGFLAELDNLRRTRLLCQQESTNQLLCSLCLKELMLKPQED